MLIHVYIVFILGELYLKVLYYTRFHFFYQTLVEQPSMIKLSVSGANKKKAKDGVFSY